MAVGQNPVTLGEHQNRWQMDVHPPQNGAEGFPHGHMRDSVIHAAKPPLPVVPVLIRPSG